MGMGRGRKEEGGGARKPYTGNSQYAHRHWGREGTPHTRRHTAPHGPFNVARSHTHTHTHLEVRPWQGHVARHRQPVVLHIKLHRDGLSRVHHWCGSCHVAERGAEHGVAGTGADLGRCHTDGRPIQAACDLVAANGSGDGVGGGVAKAVAVVVVRWRGGGLEPGVTRGEAVSAHTAAQCGTRQGTGPTHPTTQPVLCHATPQHTTHHVVGHIRLQKRQVHQTNPVSRRVGEVLVPQREPKRDTARTKARPRCTPLRTLRDEHPLSHPFPSGGHACEAAAASTALAQACRRT
jgi:hypothetical protein